MRARNARMIASEKYILISSLDWGDQKGEVIIRDLQKAVVYG